jgi:hypothetical protein
MSSDITMVELSRLESLTFSLRRLRLLRRSPRTSTWVHAVHRGLAIGRSGANMENALDLEPIIRQRHTRSGHRY